MEKIEITIDDAVGRRVKRLNRQKDFFNMLFSILVILLVVKVAMEVSQFEKEYKQTKELIKVTKENTKTNTRLLNVLGYFDIEKDGK